MYESIEQERSFHDVVTSLHHERHLCSRLFVLFYTKRYTTAPEPEIFYSKMLLQHTASLSCTKPVADDITNDI